MTGSRALARAVVGAAFGGAPFTLVETIRPPLRRSIVPVGAVGEPETVRAATVETAPFSWAAPATLRAAVTVAFPEKPASKTVAAPALTVNVPLLTTGSKKIVG